MASAVVAARIGGHHAVLDDRANRARKAEKMRVARARLTKPDATYGRAVKEANLRCTKGRSRSNSFEHSRSD